MKTRRHRTATMVLIMAMTALMFASPSAAHDYNAGGTPGRHGPAFVSCGGWLTINPNIDPQPGWSSQYVARRYWIYSYQTGQWEVTPWNVYVTNPNLIWVADYQRFDLPSGYYYVWTDYYWWDGYQWGTYDGSYTRSYTYLYGEIAWCLM